MHDDKIIKLLSIFTDKSNIQKAIIGIYGLSLNSIQVNFIKQYKPHGIVLFSRNIDHNSNSQLLNLTKQIINCSQDHTPIIFIDQEGGRVQRINPPLSSRDYPPPLSLSSTYFYNKQKCRDTIYENYYSLTKDMLKYGIKGILGPVADLHYMTNTSVISDRSFSDDPNVVIDLVTSALLGIKDAGGLSCLKHAPGHGRAKVDSHFTLPVIYDDYLSLKNTDFRVFKELVSNASVLIDYVMTAHVVFDCIDPHNPITTSVKGLKFLKSLVANKKIISDDLCMKAIQGTMTSKIDCAIEAGCDFITVCHY